MYYITCIEPRGIVDENGRKKVIRYFLAHDYQGLFHSCWWSPYDMVLLTKEEAEERIKNMKKCGYYHDEMSRHIDINTIEVREFKL